MGLSAPVVALIENMEILLDPRLATNARYRWDIVRALPPMRRTRDRAEAEAFLTAIADDPAPYGDGAGDVRHSEAALRHHGADRGAALAEDE